MNNRYVLSQLICFYYDKNIYKKISEGENYDNLVKNYIKKLNFK